MGDDDKTATVADLGSNRLPVLALEIRKAHADVGEAAKTAAARAIAAGHALIEAKGLVKHGEWLPWLREHCALAERTARLYMKIAELGLPPEAVAAIGLRGAAGSLATIVDPDYDQFADCSEEDVRQWHLFALFCSEEGGEPHGVWDHVEWILQGGEGWHSPDHWLTGELPTKWRDDWELKPIHPAFVGHWHAFRAAHAELTPEQCSARMEEIQRAQAKLPKPERPRRRRRRRALI